MPFPFEKNQFLVTPITADDAAQLMALHQRTFDEYWNEASFHTFLDDPAIFGFLLRAVGHPQRILGFIVLRVAAKEAEVITIAVDQHFRRRNIGYALMDAAMRHLYQERVEALYLEVDETNSAAQALYKKFAFREVGRRHAYYQATAQKTHVTDALVMCRKFAQPTRQTD